MAQPSLHMQNRFGLLKMENTNLKFVEKKGDVVTDQKCPNCDAYNAVVLWADARDMKLDCLDCGREFTALRSPT